jgi:CubicO group peptidase (beta-lactamase class C family)
MSHSEPGGWKTRFWERDPDPFTIARDWAPQVFKPGSSYAYSNPGMAMLGYAVTASLKDAPQKEIKSLLRERIMKPIGVPENEWSIGYGRPYDVEGMPLYATWGGGGYSPNAVARVGRLMLRKGNWDGRQLVDPKWVERMIADAGTPVPFREAPEGPTPRAGLCWWVNSDRVMKNLPGDAFMGAGAGNQVLLVVPSLDLIVVRNGEQMMENNFWGGLEKYLFDPVIDAVSRD